MAAFRIRINVEFDIEAHHEEDVVGAAERQAHEIADALQFDMARLRTNGVHFGRVDKPYYLAETVVPIEESQIGEIIQVRKPGRRLTIRRDIEPGSAVPHLVVAPPAVPAHLRDTAATRRLAQSLGEAKAAAQAVDKERGWTGAGLSEALTEFARSAKLDEAQNSPD